MISSSHKSYPIPIYCSIELTDEVECKSAAIGNNIWILYGNNTDSDDPLSAVTPELLNFDCEKRYLKTIATDFPSNFGDFTAFMAGCNDQLYIWRYYWTDRWDIENGVVGYRLFNLDTKTMKWDEIVDISMTYIKSFTPIIDNVMYIINGDEDVLKIDLATKNVELVMSRKLGYYPELIIDNGELYIKQYSDDWEASITSEFGNGVARQLECNNDNILDNCVGNNFFEVRKSGKFVFLDSIDFKTDRVVRRVVDYSKEGEKSRSIDTVSQIGDTIYAIVKVIDNSNKLSFNMCVLSLTPKLWSICMLQLVDQFGNNEEEMERIKRKLPVQLRYLVYVNDILYQFQEKY